MNKFVPKQGFYSKHMFYLLNLGILISFLLCINYSPWNQSLNKKIDKSKQKFESNKDTEQLYQQQIKAFWLRDLNEQTQYYLYAYMLLSFLPFFYLLISFLFQTFIPVDINKLHVFIVQFSLFYTGLQLLLYSVAVRQWWTILIPVILFLFIFGIGYYDISFDLVKTIAIVALLVTISCLTLMSSFMWTLILFCCVIFVLSVFFVLGLRA
jgi:hypothetical protein